MQADVPMAAGDNVIMSGTDDPNSMEDGQAENDNFNQSQEQDSPERHEDQQQHQEEQQQMDAEQEYAQMDYRICGELSKYL